MKIGIADTSLAVFKRRLAINYTVRGGEITFRRRMRSTAPSSVKSKVKSSTDANISRAVNLNEMTALPSDTRSVVS